MSDLWPEDLQVDAVKVPAAILKEQAAALRERTKNVLEGRVVAEPGTDLDDAIADQFTWHFKIFAPALNYTYDLFSINHNIELYPIIVETEDEELLEEYDEDIVISDEEALLKLLRHLFSSVRTRRIVRALLAQSAEELAKPPAPSSVPTAPSSASSAPSSASSAPSSASSVPSSSSSLPAPSSASSLPSRSSSASSSPVPSAASSPSPSSTSSPVPSAVSAPSAASPVQASAQSSSSSPGEEDGAASEKSPESAADAE